jgi:hypothetical protein
LQRTKTLLALAPAHDHAMPHNYIGALYLFAPWPVGDAAKARAHAEAAAQLFPKSRRNQYSLGLMHLKQGRKPEAATAFRAAIAGTCETETERDACDVTLREAKRGLALAQSNTQ